MLESHSLPIIPPDYALAYSALARRVSAAMAYMDSSSYGCVLGELVGAMKVIEQIECSPATLILNHDQKGQQHPPA